MHRRCRRRTLAGPEPPVRVDIIFIMLIVPV